MPYSTADYATTSGDAYFRAWQFVQPYISYATDSTGWFSAADTSSSDTPAPKNPDPPEIDRKEWSDFMDSDDE